MILTYNIAGMCLRLRSELPIRDHPRWRLFSAPHGAAADFVYHCVSLPELPEGDAPAVLRYYDSVRGRFYAVTRELGNTMDVFLTEDIPSPLTMEHLYPQLALPHVLLRGEKLLLHASYILTEQGAIVFTAPSGTGKSTQADLWRAHRGALIVNGDRVVVGLSDGAPTAYGFPLCGTSDHCHNCTAPLRAVVSLRQAETNSARLLHGGESVRVLINGTYLPEEYQSDLPRVFHAAALLTEHTPVLELSCRPDEGAVAALDALLQTIAR